MKISETLKAKALQRYNEVKDDLTSKIMNLEGLTGDQLAVPIIIDGVADELIWDFKKKKFTLIKLTVSDDPEAESLFPLDRDNVFADKVKFVELLIPEGMNNFRQIIEREL